jgi:hypothetical protein
LPVPPEVDLDLDARLLLEAAHAAPTARLPVVTLDDPAATLGAEVRLGDDGRTTMTRTPCRTGDELVDDFITDRNRTVAQGAIVVGTIRPIVRPLEPLLFGGPALSWLGHHAPAFRAARAFADLRARSMK